VGGTIKGRGKGKKDFFLFSFWVADLGVDLKPTLLAGSESSQKSFWVPLRVLDLIVA
jgi:hypothetical protein